MRRRLLLSLGLLALMLLGGYLLLWLTARPGPLEVAYGQIREGMPEREARDIIGRPESGGSGSRETALWVGGGRVLELAFRDGAVARKTLTDSGPPGPLAWLRRWLGITP